MIALTVARNMLAPHYHVPDTLAGAPRLHTADARSFEQDMASEGDKYDISFEAAVYGQADAPDVFFVLANGHAEESADELFTDFLGGVESAGSRSIATGRSPDSIGTQSTGACRCRRGSRRWPASGGRTEASG
jgi:hypothetical protein